MGGCIDNKAKKETTKGQPTENEISSTSQKVSGKKRLLLLATVVSITVAVLIFTTWLFFNPDKEIHQMVDIMTDKVTGMQLVYIPQGCFQMGSANEQADEQPVHDVCVDGYWMGKHEVTQGQYRTIMGDNPSKFKNGDDYPVENVSWDSAQEFISRLNKKSSRQFRLPTEAEWEYACRAKGNSTYCGGENIDDLAWYIGNSSNNTHPVGKKQANDFGLFDMSGNVWEWCQDRYVEDYYSNSPRNNPQGPSSGSSRVVRGGNWHYDASDARSAFRISLPPSYGSGYLGFRLVLPVGQ